MKAACLQAPVAAREEVEPEALARDAAVDTGAAASSSAREHQGGDELAATREGSGVGSAYVCSLPAMSSTPSETARRARQEHAERDKTLVQTAAGGGGGAAAQPREHAGALCTGGEGSARRGAHSALVAETLAAAPVHGTGQAPRATTTTTSTRLLDPDTLAPVSMHDVAAVTDFLGLYTKDTGMRAQHTSDEVGASCALELCTKACAHATFRACALLLCF